MNKKFLTKEDRLDNLKKRSQLIKESFKNEFNKIKRLDEADYYGDESNLSDKDLMRQGRYREALGNNYDDKPYTVEIALEGYDALVKNEAVLSKLRQEWVKMNDPEFKGMYSSEHHKIKDFADLKEKANEIAPLTILKKNSGNKDKLEAWAEKVMAKYPNAYEMWSDSNADWR